MTRPLRMRCAAVLASQLFLVVACGDDDGPADTGMADTGTADTGAPTDSGSDTGAPADAGADSGTPVDGGGDAGSPTDGGADTGTPSDGGGGTACGTSSCGPNEFCFECACGGPTSFTCTTVPSACASDRTCSCLGSMVCTTGLAMCTDRSPGHIFCDTGLD